MVHTCCMFYQLRLHLQIFGFDTSSSFFELTPKNEGFGWVPMVHTCCMFYSSDFTFNFLGLTHSSSFFDVVKMLFFERCLDPENDIPGDMYTFRYPQKKVGRFVVEVTLTPPICVTWGFVPEFGNHPKPVLLQQGKHVGIQILRHTDMICLQCNHDKPWVTSFF